MSLYSQWTDMAQMVSNDPQQMQAFWDEYFLMETEVYKKILKDKKFLLSGSVQELSEFAEMEPVVFSGFVDGINTSLKEEIDLESLAEDTTITLEILPEKLFYNMLDAKAKWLYTLTEWEGVLPEEKPEEITREWRKSGQAVSEKTVGRNDPCPCGSGKKYKKCCGK